MRYGSVCSGVEAATLAWKRLGWKCVFVSEVEPFPCAVLQERFGASAPIHPLDPAEASDEKDRKMREKWLRELEYLKKEGDLPNEGDFTKIGNKYAGKYDLLVGGTPCQDLSVAGKRAGFDGERSSLALDFVRLAYESQCKWFVWENVPGVFSSNNGNDFATLLSLFSGAEVAVPSDGWGSAGFICNARRDRYGLAWRTLDGQFTRSTEFPFAVPQRRRRVFLVGYLGDWRRAAEVLLEPGRCEWHTPARFRSWERLAGIAGANPKVVGGALRRIDGCAADRHWDGSGVNPPLNQCNAGSGIIGASNQELFSQNFNGLVTSLETVQRGGDGQSPAKAVESNAVFWNNNDYAESLTCTSDRQLMPDKARLQCVIEQSSAAGASFEINYGCPVEKELAHTLKVGTAPGTYNGVIEERDVAATLTTDYADKMELENQHVDQGCPNFVVNGFTGGGNDTGNITSTLQANLGKLLSNQTPIVCLNDQGGSVMSVETDGNTGTLRANTHGNEQIVCGAFLGTQGSKAMGIGYSEEHPPTLRAGSEVDLVQTLKIRSGKEGGGKGALVQNNISATLGCGNDQTLFILKNVISMHNKQFGQCKENLASTLLSTDYKEPQVVCYENHANDSRITESNDVSPLLSSRAGTGGGNLPLVQECYVKTARPKFAGDCETYVDTGVAPTVNTFDGGDKRANELVCESTCFAIDSVHSNSMKSANPHSGFHKEEIAKTLDTTDPNPTKNQGGNVIVDAVAIAENIIGRADDQGGNGVGAQEEVAYTQNATGVMGVCTKNIASTVRRLLPIEAERLMGFPDNHTKIAWKGKSADECPDSPRYKACGNSMCVNVMQWIGEQIERVERKYANEQ